uniref:INO80 complex subunit E N-terminal domain-containing protein n=1 Tax=Panagrolaimus superbus TaxID=310955 RepID=A0A914YRQ0_9BILA
MTYVHPQQQQYVARNGGQTQNVIIASQAQDGSRTLQTVPAQIHTIQHTVSPQNASFHLTKSSLKNVKPLNPSTQQQQQQLPQQNPPQNRKLEFVHPQNNGTQNAIQNQNNSDAQNSQSTPQKIESPKVRTKSKTTPNKAKPKIIKSSPQTQQITNLVGQPTATIQQIALPVNAQIRAPNPNIKGQEKEKSASTLQVHSVASFVQNQAPSTPAGQQPPQNAQLIQENSQKVQPSQNVQQQVSTDAVVQTVQKNVQITQQIVQKSDLQQQDPQQVAAPPQAPTNQLNQTIPVQQNKTQVSTTTSSQTTVQTASQVVTTAKIPAAPSVVKARAVVAQPKSSPAADAISPIPNDPYSGALSKLNLDLTGGDPKDSYRVLKKHFKFLVYENECYQGQLRDSHQRLLKLERDNNYLMDRLLKYETLSDSDGDESDSSIKTIEDKVLTQKTTKKRPAAKKDSSAPPRKRANVTNKPNLSNNATTTAPLPKVNAPTSKASISTVPPKTVAKPIVIKDSPGSSKPSTSSASSSAAIPQNNSNTSIQSTSTSTLSVFQANMPLPSIYKPFPPSNTSTVSTPSTPTTDTSFVAPKTNGPVVAKKPVLSVPKPAPPKAKVIIADLPKIDNRSKPQSSPTTSAASSSNTSSEIPESKVFTVVSRAPIPLRNPTPQSNATVTYSTLKPNAMIPRPVGQMPSQNRMLLTRPKIQIIQPPPMNPSTTTPQYNVQQNTKLRPQLKDNSIVKKESPSKPNS